MEYKGKMQFNVKHSSYEDITCVIEIDFDAELLIENIKETVQFWSGWQDRLDINDGDYVKTFIQQLASNVQWVALKNNYNTFGVRSEFADMEGWFEMDGSKGVTLLQHTTIEYEDFEFDVHQTSGVEAAKPNY